MLERYFVRPDTVDRILASWIGEPVERYVGWLAGHGYATRTVLRRVPILVGFGAFAADRGAARWDDYAEITIRSKEAALQACAPPTTTSAAFPRRPVWRDDTALLDWLASL